MNDIAFSFRKVNLEDFKYVFKPVDVIMGKYIKEENIFLTQSGFCYEYIVGGCLDADDLFGYPTTISNLKKEYSEKYGKAARTSDILYEYASEIFRYLYLGYYDTKISGLNFIRIPFSSIDKFIEKNTSSSIDFKLDDKFINIKVDSDLKLADVKEDADLKLADEKSNVNKSSNSKKQKKIVLLKDLREEVLSKIVGQDNAVNDITRTIMINQTSKNPKNKQHILVVGPTGTGKTEIVKIICQKLELPYFEADATAYTKEGYVGKSVYSMLEGLLYAADNNIEKAQNGILVIDEIDKKIYGQNEDNEFSKGVLYGLLKIMDRGKIEFKDNEYFDTSNLTIILMGAFENSYHSKLKENNNTIGFNDSKSILNQRDIVLTKDDIIKSGMPSEFLGRIGNITSTTAFSESDLVNILNNSDISALKLQKEYFKEAFGVKLTNTRDYVEEIAKKAIKAKTNARELRPLINESLKFATDEFLMGRKAKTLKLTKETVLDPKKYYIK